MPIPTLSTLPRLSLPAALRNTSLARTAESLWSNVRLSNGVPSDRWQIEEVHASTLPVEHDDAQELTDEEIEGLRACIHKVEQQLGQEGLEEGPLLQLNSQLQRLRTMLDHHAAHLPNAAPAVSTSPAPGNELQRLGNPLGNAHRASCSDALPASTLAWTPPNALQNLVARVTGNTSRPPAQSTALALSVIAVAGPSSTTQPTLRSTASSFYQSVNRLIQSKLERLDQRVSHSVARQQHINRTEERKPYTRLEALCAFERTSSRATRLFKPTNSTLIIRALKKEGHQYNVNGGSYGPLHLAVASGHIERVSALLDNCKGFIDVNRISEVFDTTALGKAIEADDQVSAKLLLAANATPRTIDFVDAAKKGHVALFRMLHQHWLDSKRPANIDFRQVLHHAVTSQSAGCSVPTA